jgi:hypothetical protein
VSVGSFEGGKGEKCDAKAAVALQCVQFLITSVRFLPFTPSLT